MKAALGVAIADTMRAQSQEARKQNLLQVASRVVTLPNNPWMDRCVLMKDDAASVHLLPLVSHQVSYCDPKHM